MQIIYEKSDFSLREYIKKYGKRAKPKANLLKKKASKTTYALPLPMLKTIML